MMLWCIKQHLSNIWSSIHENAKQHWGWVEKNVAYKKMCIYVPPMSYVSLYWKNVFCDVIFSSVFIFLIYLFFLIIC